MKVTKTLFLHPLMRWRWDAVGVFGYSATKRGATKAARDAVAEREVFRGRIR